MSSIFTGAMIGDEHTFRDWGAVITNSDVIAMPIIDSNSQNYAIFGNKRRFSAIYYASSSEILWLVW